MRAIRDNCRTDKGVSPIIATLLLIVIAVAAAVVTYTFVMGFLGSTSGNTGPRGQLNYDSYSGSPDVGNLVIYLRNTGIKSVTLDKVYVNGVAYSYDDTVGSGKWCFDSIPNNMFDGPGKDLDAASTGELYLQIDTLNEGRSHIIKIVCVDGTALEFSIRL